MPPILLTLPLLTPSIAVEILPLGLTVHRIYLQADGRTHDLVVGPDAQKDHLDPPHKSVNALTNQLPAAAQGNGTRASDDDDAPQDFDALTWDPIPIATSTLFSKSELNHLTSSSPLSPDEDNSHACFRLVSHGATGTLTIEVLVALIPPRAQALKYCKAADARGEEFGMGSILFVYRAKLEPGEGGQGTPINLSHHLGFNLDASLKQPDSLTIKSHKLIIKSEQVIKLNPVSDVPMKAPLPVSDDDRKHDGTKTLRETWEEPGFEEYHCFPPDFPALGPSSIPLIQLTDSSDFLEPLLQKGKRDYHNVQLEGGKSGVKLMFSTNQPGVTLYTHNRADASQGGIKKIHGGGTGYGPGTAVFLDFCDVRNGSEVVTSDEVYNRYVRVDVRYRETGST